MPDLFADDAARELERRNYRPVERFGRKYLQRPGDNTWIRADQWAAELERVREKEGGASC